VCACVYVRLTTRLTTRLNDKGLGPPLSLRQSRAFHSSHSSPNVGAADVTHPPTNPSRLLLAYKYTPLRFHSFITSTSEYKSSDLMCRVVSKFIVSECKSSAGAAECTSCFTHSSPHILTHTHSLHQSPSVGAPFSHHMSLRERVPPPPPISAPLTSAPSRGSIC